MLGSSLRPLFFVESIPNLNSGKEEKYVMAVACTFMRLIKRNKEGVQQLVLGLCIIRGDNMLLDFTFQEND
ncbi:hypothetical protein QVD17_17169 [Tagetes erecta]|uniref:Uncharacterized protein n=1 Tax=Tagetes erecta TaxID=13708 RepID=A0AAD8KAU7_TARER|nr:hypothetical protein QVD17_27240 [Tagetes erecta]KAK1428336.1 hypothetical protein QVD17_17169 [Tagetes erecta]